MGNERSLTVVAALLAVLSITNALQQVVVFGRPVVVQRALSTGKPVATRTAEPPEAYGYFWPEGGLRRVEMREALDEYNYDEQLPKTLQELHHDFNAVRRFSVGEISVRHKGGRFTVSASRQTHPYEIYDGDEKPTGKFAPKIGYATILQSFDSGGRAIDGFAGIDRGETILKMTVSEGEDWVYFDSMFRCDIFSLDDEGKLLLMLSADGPSSVVFEDIDGDKAAEMLIPAKTQWRFLTRDDNGMGYGEQAQLATDNFGDWDPRTNIKARSLTTGLFIVDYAFEGKVALDFGPSISYWSSEDWLWWLMSREQKGRGWKSNAWDKQFTKHPELIGPGA